MNTESPLELIYSAHRYLQEMERCPRDFGLGELLYPSDIHTVVAVAEQEGCNLTELSLKLEISLPAAFKAAGKMLKKGYLSKQHRQGNAKEVVFFLSDRGREAVKKHQEFEQEYFGKLRNLEKNLSASDRQIIQNFLVELKEATKE